jgi:hypothetical protein
MPTKKKVVRFDFFRVEMPQGAQRFEELLQQIARMPNNESRTLDLGDRFVRLHRVQEAGGVWEGDLTRIRMTAVPAKAGMDGSLEPFEFEDDEGLGEESAFLYHRQTRVLVMQYNHFGMTPTLFARYIERMGDLDGMIDFNPAIRPDAINRLANIEQIRRLEIGLAGVDNSTAFDEQGNSLSGIIDVLDAFRAPSANITVSMGHEPGGMARQTVTRTLNALLRNHASTIRKLKVSGIEDDQSQIIDLIEDRLVEMAEIELDEHRRLPYQSRREALHAAWSEHRNGLRTMFQVVE